MDSKLIDTINECLVPLLNPEFMIVFGSFASGSETLKSDLDIAFYREGESLSKYERFMISQKLAELINRDVDLIDLKEASTVFRAQIFGYGQTIYSRNDIERDRQHMTALSMYVKLNEERQVVFDAIRERGRIYE
ncbi:hypothetical protein JNUCC1_02074 [Lentibacillus sp. JNUCC-1]|uniref:type VII toxin-antitoxin system MntA family adenylyltransferase antitoxin n=1 Tax=Lentibacillus sp. JNUCC-1 TaxID=2654513 RepID=UPI0012E8F056|nr:nucleotidyltransferase domain-containing protein [Lentibacillus sp. JNUCC-1]MUV38238.1 hypothetical protein [Lentibacillus sp. JNUCC-1]